MIQKPETTRRAIHYTCRHPLSSLPVAMLLLAVVAIAGCGGSGDADSEDGATGPPKPKLVGQWEGDIGSGIKYTFTVTRNGEFAGSNPLTGRPNVMFVVSAVDGNTVILRHISEADDENASEGKVEFVDADTIELWPPSGLQALKETSYTLTRVPGSSPNVGPPLDLPKEAKRVVGTWETNVESVAAPPIRLDLMPDGTLIYALQNYPESRGSWRYKGTDGDTLLIETGTSSDSMGVARITFQTDGRMVMTEDDGSNSQTFTRIESLIE